MGINRFASFCVLALTVFLAGPAFGQAPAKAGLKSITVYKTPT
jgi:hypothetical protein